MSTDRHATCDCIDFMNKAFVDLVEDLVHRTVEPWLLAFASQELPNDGVPKVMENETCAAQFCLPPISGSQGAQALLKVPIMSKESLNISCRLVSSYCVASLFDASSIRISECGAPFPFTYRSFHGVPQSNP